MCVATCSPWRYRARRKAPRNADDVQTAEPLMKEKPQIQLTARSATSIAHAQFTPYDHGLCAIQSVTSATNSWGYRSSPVSQYACPSAVKCWHRLSSHGTLMSVGRSSSL